MPLSMKLRSVFPLLFLFCAGALHADPLSIATGKNADIFAPGETLTFQILHFPGESGKYEITDSDDTLIASGDILFTEGMALLQLPPRKEWEKRHLTFSIGGTSVSFAVLPERTSAKGGDDRFGCWINKDRFCEKLYEAGVRIGVTTSYPHWNLDRQDEWLLYKPPRLYHR